MTIPSFKTVLAEFDKGVLRLTLNRPEVSNAMSLAMIGELQAALAWAEAARNVRVIVLSGAGGNFSAGADIRDLSAALGRSRESDADPIGELSRTFGTVCAAYASTGIATIAIVEGVAMGGGFGLVCASDVTIAAPDARFGLPETRRGFVPAQIAPLLVERLGYSRAKLLAVLGGNIRADEAFRLGLVHEVTEDLPAALASALASILSCAPGALGATKKLLREVRFADPSAMVGRAAEVFVNAVRGPEGIEGTAAFLAKRRPSWAPSEGSGNGANS